MALGVDSSQWKPRRSQGTPLWKLRDRVSLGVLAVGVAIGLFCVFAPNIKLRNALTNITQQPESETDLRRRLLMDIIARRTGDEVRKAYDATQKIDEPYS